MIRHTYRIVCLLVVLVLGGCQTYQPQSPAPQRDAEVQTPDWPGSQPQDDAPAPASPSAVALLQTQVETAMAGEDWPQAIEIAERGLRIDRRNGDFYTALAHSYLALGQTEQARNFAMQAQRFCGRDCREVKALLSELDATSAQ